MIIQNDGTQAPDPIDAVMYPPEQGEPRPDASFNRAINVLKLLIEGLDVDSENYAPIKTMYENMIDDLKSFSLIGL